MYTFYHKTLRLRATGLAISLEGGSMDVAQLFRGAAMPPPLAYVE